MTKKQIKTLVIALLIAVASMVGYKVSIEEITPTQTEQTTTIDSTLN